MISKFGEFLYDLRKEKGLTQTELADKLNITNKAVSKWETGEAFPETAQLVPIAGIFGITVDELLRGERNIVLNKEEKAKPVTDINKIELKPMDKKEAITTASAVALILLGVLLLIVLSLNNVNYGIYVSTLLLCVAVAVFALVYMGMRRTLRSGELDEDNYLKGLKYTLMIASGVAIVIMSVIPIIAMSAYDITEAIYLPIFFAVLIVGIFLLIFGGISWDAFSKKYSLPTDEAQASRNGKKVEDAVCGTIMLLATATFLILGFIYDLWHPGWVVFPIGGILCGIASTIIKGCDGKDKCD